MEPPYSAAVYLRISTAGVLQQESLRQHLPIKIALPLQNWGRRSEEEASRDSEPSQDTTHLIDTRIAFRQGVKGQEQEKGRTLLQLIVQ